MRRLQQWWEAASDDGVRVGAKFRDQVLRDLRGWQLMKRRQATRSRQVNFVAGTLIGLSIVVAVFVMMT
jgi:hypothetical protein